MNLKREIEFLFELEKLKTVYRRNGVLGDSRKENSAKHSWLSAVMAVVLANNKFDNLKVVKMLLIDDIVEIDAGDTFIFDEKRDSSYIKEEKVAERTFDILPNDKRDDFLSLWKEFESRKTPESKFAACIDGLQPLINHYLTTNSPISDEIVTKEAIIKKKLFIKEFSPSLWDVAIGYIEKNTVKGLYVE